MALWRGREHWLRHVLAIAPSALIVAVGTLLAKTTAFLKEILVAYAVGPGADLDTFLFAFLFPAFLVSLLSGALQSAFVPQYLVLRAQSGPHAARRAAAQCAVVSSAMLFGVALLFWPLFVRALPALAQGFDARALESTGVLIAVLLPVVLFNGMAAFWSGVLYAEGRFGAASLVPVITPLCVLGSLWAHWTVSAGSALAMGTVVGAAAEAAIIAACVRRAKFMLFAWPALSDPIWRRLSGQFLPAVGANLLMAGTTLVDQSFAARLAQGSVSTLAYGTKLGGVASSMLVIVFSAIALPTLARSAAAEDWVALRRTSFAMAIVALAVTVPLAVTLSGFSEEIIALLFQRGKFSADATSAAAMVQELYAWHVPFYVVGVIAMRALVAMRATGLVMLGSALNLLADFGVNAFAVPRMGVPGIGLATTVMYGVSCAFLCWAALRRLRSMRGAKG